MKLTLLPIHHGETQRHDKRIFVNEGITYKYNGPYNYEKHPEYYYRPFSQVLQNVVNTTI